MRQLNEPTPDGRSGLSTRPISSILQDMLKNLSEIIRSEIQLAQAELRQEARAMARAGVYLAAAGVLGFLALGFSLLSAVYALATMMPAWLAAILVGVVTGVVATVLLVMGQRRLKVTSLKPEKTIKTMEDNITWFKKQVK
jgi:tetrahydromethanopterin S-methyltransferase subunit C